MPVSTGYEGDDQIRGYALSLLIDFLPGKGVGPFDEDLRRHVFRVLSGSN